MQKGFSLYINKERYSYRIWKDAKESVILCHVVERSKINKWTTHFENFFWHHGIRRDNNSCFGGFKDPKMGVYLQDYYDFFGF